jgi:hypothetical protein
MLAKIGMGTGAKTRKFQEFEHTADLGAQILIVFDND